MKYQRERERERGEKHKRSRFYLWMRVAEGKVQPVTVQVKD